MIIYLSLLIANAAPPTSIIPLRHAHAHNDYAHKRPLSDALAHGFTSVEADVFLAKNGELLIGHDRWELRPDRTLEKLYLKPLLNRVRDRDGRVYSDRSPFYLLVDLKTEGRSTYQALIPLLHLYSEMLTTTENGRTVKKAVTVVISGNVPRDLITSQRIRHAAIDGRPNDLDSDLSADLIPWISASWSSQFRWRGVGPMPTQERIKLRQFVEKAHHRKRMVRFWATPESTSLWRELLDAKVDLLNTDRLGVLQRFLLDASSMK